MEWILNWLAGTAVTRGWRWLWWLVGKLSIRRPAVNVYGLDFFPSRTILEKERPLDDLLDSARDIDAMFQTGDKLLRKEEWRPKIKRVLLPNPDSASVKYCEESLDQDGMAGFIRQATQIAAKREIETRWTDAYLGYSILIINKVDDDARVHIEFAMPPLQSPARPSITIWKRRFPGAFKAFVDGFERIWRSAKAPS